MNNSNIKPPFPKLQISSHRKEVPEMIKYLSGLLCKKHLGPYSNY